MATETAAPARMDITIERFDHAATARDRGTRVRATVDPGKVRERYLPTVWVMDSGDVEIGELAVDPGTAVAWLRAVADHIDARQDAS